MPLFYSFFRLSLKDFSEICEELSAAVSLKRRICSFLIGFFHISNLCKESSNLIGRSQSVSLSWDFFQSLSLIHRSACLSTFHPLMEHYSFNTWVEYCIISVYYIFYLFKVISLCRWKLRRVKFGRKSTKRHFCFSKSHRDSHFNSEIFKNILSGRYVPFGVFRMFNDSSLDNILDTFLKLSVSIPEPDLMTYPKLSSAFFSCFSVLSSEQFMTLGDIDVRVLEYLLNLCVEGIKSDTYTSSQSCR